MCPISPLIWHLGVDFPMSSLGAAGPLGFNPPLPSHLCCELTLFADLVAGGGVGQRPKDAPVLMHGQWECATFNSAAPLLQAQGPLWILRV